MHIKTLGLPKNVNKIVLQTIISKKPGSIYIHNTL